MGQRILFGGGGSPHRGPLWDRNLPLDPQVIMGRQAISSKPFALFLRLLFGFASVNSASHRALQLSGIQQPSVDWSRRGDLVCSCSSDANEGKVSFEGRWIRLRRTLRVDSRSRLVATSSR